MWINKLSIKAVTTANLIVIGTLIIALSIYLGTTYKNVAQDDEKRIISRITQVTSTQNINKLERQAILLGESAAKSPEFRKALKNILAIENKELGLIHLDDQFSQRWVTAEIVNLVKLRVYDKKLNFLIASNKGDSSLSEKLPAFISKIASTRSNSDRL